MAMLDAAAAGELRALWVVGWDLLQTQPNMTATAEALAGLDLLIVQDPFLNETAAAHATVFLPACTSYEKDGTFMNGERRVQRVRQTVRPSGDTRPDWEITCMAAQALGRQELFDFASPEQIWDEIRQVWPAGAGHDLRPPGRSRRSAVAVPHHRPSRDRDPSHRLLRCRRRDRDADAGGLPAQPRATRSTSTPSCSSPAGASTSSTPAP